ncbi:MAG: sulfatase-like hydrolase/transferase [Acidobacteriota bacterium]|nr:sulfatase-like hydrolase/transferase [Acidobacteriota bacterium]
MIGGIAAASALRAQTRTAGRRRPNFLFILADDHAGYVLGCDGNTVAHTPNIDAFAAEGTRFAAHHCNSPVCTPSRQCPFTGQMPHSAGVTVLRTALSPDKPTLAKQFKTAGFQTAVFGKMHFNRPAEKGLYGFDVMMTENELTAAWRKDVKPRPIPAGILTLAASLRGRAAHHAPEPGPAVCPVDQLSGTAGERRGIHQDCGMEVHLLLGQTRPPGRLPDRRPHARALPPALRLEERPRRVHRCVGQAPGSGHKLSGTDSGTLPLDPSGSRKGAAATEHGRSHRVLPASARFSGNTRLANPLPA